MSWSSKRAAGAGGGAQLVAGARALLLQCFELAAGLDQRGDAIAVRVGHLVDAPHRHGGTSERVHFGGLVAPLLTLQVAHQRLARLHELARRRG